VRSQVSIDELNSRSLRVIPESAPAETSDARSHVDQIREVLDAVGVRTREIYFAHRAGFSYAEIAGHLNISQRAIKRHIARAVLAIMEDLKP
jgi:DNA-directed RNA polymerase specialized sigma24 family protein